MPACGQAPKSWSISRCSRSNSSNRPRSPFVRYVNIEHLPRCPGLDHAGATQAVRRLPHQMEPGAEDFKGGVSGITLREPQQPVVSERQPAPRRHRCSMLGLAKTHGPRPMIDLYTAPTPNGYKASVMLEEIALPYAVHAIDLPGGGQKTPRVPRDQPERPHPGDRRPRRGRFRGVRVGRDPDLPGREDRQAAARRRQGAFARDPVADVPDGRHRPDDGAGQRLLPLLPGEDPAGDRPATRTRCGACSRCWTLGSPRRVPGRGLLDRRHRQLVLGAHLALVGGDARGAGTPAALAGVPGGAAGVPARYRGAL